MEFEIPDEPQGEPERPDARRDGGLREGGGIRRPAFAWQPGEAPPQSGEAPPKRTSPEYDPAHA